MIQRREQKILQALKERADRLTPDLESRAESLPAMLLRHGPAQTLIFLYSKTDSKSDVELANLMTEIAREVSPTQVPTALDLASYARMDLAQRLRLSTVFVEVATLMSRYIQAKQL